MITMLEETGQAFSDFVNGTISDLFEGGFTGKQVADIEKMLLINITVMMHMYSDTPQESLKDVARALTEDSIVCPYTFNEETGELKRHSVIEIQREYRPGIKATINLNPYIAQYERI